MAAGAALSISGQPLEAFAGTFTVDMTPPMVTGASISEGDLLPSGPADIWIQFSEPMDPVAMEYEDIQLYSTITGNMADFTWSYAPDDQRLHLSVQNLADGPYEIYLGSWSFCDLAGNQLDGGEGPGSDYTLNFAAHAVEAPLPPFASQDYPQAAFIFETQQGGQLSDAADEDTYTVSLNAGQHLSVRVQPQDSVRLALSVTRQSDGALLGSAEASDLWATALLQDVAIDSAGTYVIHVNSVEWGDGVPPTAYDLSAFLDVHLEQEGALAGADNGTPQTAESLDGSAVALGSGADRMAVKGYADAADEDWYSFTANTNQRVSVSLMGGYFPVGTSQGASASALAYEGSATTVEVYDPAGNLVMSCDPSSDPPTVSFTAFASGQYFARVVNTEEQWAWGDYTLVVGRDSGLDSGWNDDIDSAQDISGDLAVQGYLDDAGEGDGSSYDSDFYAFTAGEADSLVLSTATPVVGPGQPELICRPHLALYAWDGTVLAESEDAPDGINQILSYDVPEGEAGPYYVAVTGTAGNYTLLLQGATTQHEPLTVMSTEPPESPDMIAFPQFYDVDFAESIQPMSVGPEDLLIDGAPALSAEMISPTTVRFRIASTSGMDGPVTVTIPAGAITSLDGATNEQFDSSFVADVIPPRVAIGSIAEGDLLPAGSLTYTATFTEPLGTEALDAHDVSLVGGFQGQLFEPSDFQYDDATNTLTVTFDDLPDGHFALTLTSGADAFCDTYGLPLDGNYDGGRSDYVVHFQTDADRTDFPSLAQTTPAGSLSYFGVVDATGYAAGDVDLYDLGLNAGQNVTILLVARNQGLRQRVSLLDGDGNVVATAEASQGGQSLMLSEVPVPAEGPYTLSVEDLDGAGYYRLRLMTNTDIEQEVVFPVGNNSLASAQNIDGSSFALGDGIDRLSVAGGAATWANLPGGDDYYSFTLTAGQVVTVVTNGPESVTLLDASGGLIAIGMSPEDGSVTGIPDFVVPETGTYYACVTPGSARYSLVVIRGATIGVEDTWSDSPEDISLAQAVIGHSYDGESHWYSVVAQEGDTLMIDASALLTGEFDPTGLSWVGVALYSPDWSAAVGTDGETSASFVYVVPPGGAGQYTIEFTGAGEGDFFLRAQGATAQQVNSPEVVSTTPEEGSRRPSLDTIDVQFSDFIDGSSVDSSDLSLPGGVVTGAELTAGDTVRYTVEGPQADGDYTYTVLPGAVRNLQGEGNAEYTGAYTIDSTPPTVVAVTSVVPMRYPTRVTFTFSEPVDVNRLGTPIVSSLLTPNGGEARWWVSSVTGDGNTVQVDFHPDSQMGTYQMTIQGVFDLSGLPMASSYTAAVQVTAGDLQVTGMTVTPLPEGAIAEAFNPANGHYYYVLNGNSWPVVRAAAQAMGADLAVIDDAAENQFIQTNIVNQYGDVWLGLGQDPADGAWKWVDGRSLDDTGYSNWGDSYYGPYAVMTWDGSWVNRPEDWGYNALVESATLIVGDLHSGSYVSVQWETTNTGLVGVDGIWYDTLQVTNSAGQNIHGGYAYQPNAAGLAPGDHLQNSLSFRLPDGVFASGELTFTVTADGWNYIPEQNAQGTAEQNNSRSVTLDSTMSPYADLVVRNVTVVPSTTQSGRHVTISWEDHNIGTLATRTEWYDQIVISRVSDGLEILNTSAYTYAETGLDPQGFRSMSYGFDMPVGYDGVGEYQVTVTTDCYGWQAEYNVDDTAESNNSANAALQSSFAPAPDLEVTGLQVTVLPAGVVNAAYDPANGHCYYLLSSRPWSDARAAAQACGADLVVIDDAAENEFVRSHFAAPYGSIWMGMTDEVEEGAWVWVDGRTPADVGYSNWNEGEPNGSGNSAQMYSSGTWDDWYGTSAMYALIESASPIVASGGATSGSCMWVQWQETNTGQADLSNSWHDRVQVTDSTGQNSLYWNDGVAQPNAAGLAAGDWVGNSLVLRIPDGTIGAGDLVFSVTADSWNRIREWNPGGTGETNNAADVTVHSTFAPYVDLTAENVTVEPARPQSSGQVTVSWEDHNHGALASYNGWYDLLQVQRISDGWTFLYTSVYFDRSAGDIGPDGSRAMSCTFSMPAAADGVGDYRVTVVADGWNYQPEYNVAGNAENNNSATTTFTSDWATYPDLEVQNLAVTADPALQCGSVVTISWEDFNHGNGATPEISWGDRVTVVNTSTGETLLDANVFYDEATNGPLAAGHSTPMLTQFTLPDGPRGVGDLQVTVTADQHWTWWYGWQGEITEYNADGTAESNNSATGSFTSGLAPTVGIVLDSDSDSGASHSDGLTNVAAPTVFVTVNQAGMIAVDFDGDGVADVTQAVPAADTYSITAPSPLSDGSHAVTATFTVGALPAATASTMVTIDTVGPRIVGGVTGTALDFDGVDDVVVTPDVTHGMAEGSLSLWFRAASWNPRVTPAGLYLWSSSPNAPDGCWDGMNLGSHPGYTGGEELLFGIWGGGWNWAHSGGVPTPGQWYHVVATWGPGGIALYVDGQLAGTNPYTGPAPSSAFNFLGRSSWPSSEFNGDLDEVRIFRQALTPEQVQADMAGSLPLPADQLAVRYTFDDASGTTLTDSSGNGQDGVLGYGVAGWQPQWVPSDAPNTAAQAATVWDPTAEFSITNGNPNGVWSYGWDNGGSFVPYTSTWSNGWDGWRGNIGGDGTPIVGRNDSTWTSCNVAPGQLTLHPGPSGQASILRWTAPCDMMGDAEIAGSFLPGDSGSMRVSIAWNGVEQWYASDSGTFDLELPVHAGDTVDFRVGNAYYSGNTPLVATIVAVPALGSDVQAPASSQVIKFSEPIDLAASLAAGMAWTLTGPGGETGAITGITAIGGSGDTYRVTFDPITTPGVWTLATDLNVFDLAGNAANQDGDAINGEAGQDKPSETFTLVGDEIPPTVTDFSPAGAQTAFTGFDVTFSEDIRAFDGSVVSVIGPGGAIAPDDITVTGGPRNFHVAFAQPSDGQYTISLGAGIQDLAGNDTTAYEAVVTLDTFGPAVTELTTGPSNLLIDYADVTFDSPVDVGTFTTADATITGPSGAVAVTGVTRVSDTAFRLTFAPQQINGVYTVTVGPDVADFARNPMNQDGDAANGEAEDAFVGTYTVALPDLVPTGLAVSPAAPQSGNHVTISWTDENQGGGETPSGWSDLVTVVNTTTGETLLSTLVSYDPSKDGAVAAGLGGAMQAEFTLPDGVRGVGDLRVTVTTDYWNNVREGNDTGDAESNNGAEITVTATLAPYVDLTVQNITVNPLRPQSSRQVTITWEDHNVGDLASNANWYDRVLIQRISDGHTILDVGVYADHSGGDIASGGFRAMSHTFTMPFALEGVGDYEVTVTADGSGWQPEFNAAGDAETNNAATAAFTSDLAPYPDLVVHGLGVTADPSLQSGSVLTISWEDFNRGDGDTGATNWGDLVTVVNTRTGETLLSRYVGYDHSANGTLLAGHGSAMQTQFTIPDGVRGVGDLRVSVVADNWNNVGEYYGDGSAETNNTAEATLTTTLAHYADLTVSNVAVDPSSAQSSHQVTIAWEDHNDGDLATSRTWYDLVQVRRVSDGQNIVWTAVCVDAAGGNTDPDGFRAMSYTFTMPYATDGVGDFEATVVADYWNYLPEFNAADTASDNNSAGPVPFTSSLAAYPDLVPVGVSSAAAPSLLSGANITISWQDRNDGNLAAATADGSWYDHIWVTRRSDGQVMYDNWVPFTGTIAIGAAADRSATLTLPRGLAGVGDFDIHVVANAQNEVLELPYSNNTAAPASFTTALADADRADLRIVSIDPLPNALHTGDRVTFRWTIKNIGYVDAVAGSNHWTDQALLRMPDNSVVTVAEIVHDGPLGAQQSYSGDASVDITVAGDYQLQVLTDTGNSLSEYREDNNHALAMFSAARDYAVSVHLATPTLADLNGGWTAAYTPVTLSGDAAYLDDSSAAAGMPVIVTISANGSPWPMSVLCDANGHFSFTYAPWAIGSYTVLADHPDDATPIVPPSVQATFTVIGMSAAEGSSVSITPGEAAQTGSFTLTNLTSVPLTGLAFTLRDVVPNVRFLLLDPLPTELGDTAVTIRYSASAVDDSFLYNYLYIHVSSAEGAVADSLVRVFIEDVHPHLAANPGYLSGGMLVGGHSEYTFTLTNIGVSATGEMTVTLPTIDQAPFLSVDGGLTVASLAPGESRTITLDLDPAADLTLTNWTGRFSIGNSLCSITEGYSFRARSAQTASLAISVQDDLTLYGEAHPRVAGATVKLLDALDSSHVIAQAVTGEDGIAVFDSVPVGPYLVSASATDHQQAQKTVTVSVGGTAAEIFIARDLVHYTWVVEPTEIQDHYNIHLEATFDTQVPVGMTLDVSALPDIYPGESATMTVTLHNISLISIQDVRVLLPNDPEYHFSIGGTMDYAVGEMAPLQTLVLSMDVSRSYVQYIPSRYVWFQGPWSYQPDDDPAHRVYNVALDCLYLPGRYPPPLPPAPPSPPVYTPPGGGGYGGGWIGGGGGGSSDPIPVVTNIADAKVRLSIDQSAVMTRAAFHGKMDLTNDSGAALHDVHVNLSFTDAQGNDASSAFFYQSPVVSGFSGAGDITSTLDGMGLDLAGTDGLVQYLFIPTNSAAPLAPTVYNIGGTLSYEDEGGSEVNIPMIAATITVYPDAHFVLNYFWQRDVIGDDPFTPGVVEPSESFYLGVIASNVGHGDGKDFTITSEQPKVVNNPKDLEVDFTIVGTKVGAGDIDPTLTANLGNIAAGASETAEWRMLSALQGHFEDFTASFNHDDALGGKATSLIDATNIYEMIHPVLNDLSGQNDFRPDFLAVDPNLPSNGTVLYGTCDGPTDPITHGSYPVDVYNDIPNALFDSRTGESTYVSFMQAGTQSTQVSQANGDRTVSFDAMEAPGWNYVEVLVLLPGGNPAVADGYTLTSLVRSDGKVISLGDNANAWESDRVFCDYGFLPVNLLHVLDNVPEAGTYTYRAVYQAIHLPPALTAIEAVPARAGASWDTMRVFYDHPVAPTTFNAAQVSLRYRASAADPWTSISTAGLHFATYLANASEGIVSGLSALTSTPGDYELTYNGQAVSDLYGSPGSGSQTVSWHLNTPPTVGALPATSLYEGMPILWADSLTTPELLADPFSGKVNWGDGTADQGLTIVGQAFNLRHTFADSGVYDVSITVRDVWGATSTMTQHVNVTNLPPTVSAGANTTAGAGVTWTGAGSFRDSGADTWAGQVDYGDGAGFVNLPLNADKTFDLSKTYANPGTYTITVKVTDKDGGIGIATRQMVVSASSPQVSVTINDGSAQRSMVTSITYAFSTDVTLDSDAFQLTRVGGVASTIEFTNPSNDHRTYVLTFAGSLSDGRYSMVVAASKVHGLALASDNVLNFHRLFGDSDGDGDTDTTDLAAFRAAMNVPANYRGFFDYDSDGGVNATDYTQFRARLGKSV